MTPYLQDADCTLWHGDALDVLAGLPAESVDCVVTSPPYWGLRDYGTGAWEGGDEGCDHAKTLIPRALDDPGIRMSTLEGGKKTTTAQAEGSQFRDVCGKCGARRVDAQLGLEPTPDRYVTRLVEVFREVRRVLCAHGTCWVNLGSSYASGDTQPSRPRHGAPAYDSDGTSPADSPAPGSAYSDLCDECLDDFLRHHGRSSDTRQPLGQDEPPLSLTGRGSELKGSASTSLAASLLDAPASTTLRSWLQQRAPCSRCASRAFSLSGVRSSASDAPASAHMSWLNYISQLKAKDMVPTPWMVAMALQQDGWYLRSDIIWAKPNPMPESVTDRPTKSHEYVFLLTKQPEYFFDQEAVRESAEYGRRDWGDGRIDYDGGTDGVRRKVTTSGGGAQTAPQDETLDGSTGEAPRGPDGRRQTHVEAREGSLQHRNGDRWPNGPSRNVRSVWTIATQPYPEAHFATYPEELVRRCVLAGCAPRVCRVCGEPSVRIVDVQQVPDKGGGSVADRQFVADPRDSGKVRGWGEKRTRREVDTLGWSDCGHNDWRPGVVLDPFVGSGTTCLVARNHGRHSVGIDLNETYLELAATRLQQLSLLTGEAHASQ